MFPVAVIISAIAIAFGVVEEMHSERKSD